MCQTRLFYSGSSHLLDQPVAPGVSGGSSLLHPGAEVEVLKGITGPFAPCQLMISFKLLCSTIFAITKHIWDQKIRKPSFFLRNSWQETVQKQGFPAGFDPEFPGFVPVPASRTVTSPEGAWFTLCEYSPRSSFCTPWKQQEATAAGTH